jgi:hypothetical protein
MACLPAGESVNDIHLLMLIIFKSGRHQAPQLYSTNIYPSASHSCHYVWSRRDRCS